MSALARFFSSKGFAVAGYDRTPSPLTSELQTEGIEIIYDDTVAALPVAFTDKLHTMVVRTPAVPESQAQLRYFVSEGFLIFKRAEVLGQVTRQMRALCVAGTHGKTTTSTILAHLMYQSEINCNAFLGGISNNYGTNLLLSAESNYVVVEADEFDRSFHHLHPYMSVITAVDPDHLDVYGNAEGFREGFEYYTSLIRPGGALIMKKGLALTPRLGANVRCYTYAVDEEADFWVDNIKIEKGEIRFDFHTPNESVLNLKLGVPAYVNIENSVAAMAVAWLNGVSANELRLGLASYSGVYRRFNVHVNNSRIAYIDDYAHHPTELQATIRSVRVLFPERKLVGVFQPHLYTRTRDFADAFARVLSELDEVLLLPIYPAREEPIEGVSSEMLLDKITCGHKAVVSKENLIGHLQGQQNAVVVTFGAGDIDRLVSDIAKALK
ncbi:MAG: UDP-N-acetylmuramate--L-alanine ligase [Paludibacter sp.]|nr:UDP-N-acetylmuramate--L-alanine ligase [Bacteroidales bacterium]MCM1069207.1 UDP-N-acetylmuramate--L-alanine ligase [Prevotella sp.]MCM1354112.1 UDP-N-acetylmuramate--L-alanine ligase [Bacteroides sp.]MCM1442915.1 UDP-N-acetylmuramate--L-alanine ligase [Muribaculum sp.]MCM1481762.1 UDP-N-acetylmuramate--L-alanine ligase [Paludibacter sp.]